MTLDEAKQVWSDILTHGRAMTPREAIIADLVEYSGRSLDEVRTLATSSQSISEQKWNSADRSTPEGLRDFYRSVSNWVFGTLNYHARQAESDEYPLPVQVAAALGDKAPGDHLDFGAGVATASLLFARMGWRPVISDVSPPLLEFARWRCAQHGIEARFIDLNDEALGETQYDLITAFNTFAHIPEIDSTLRDLHRALRPGGSLIFDIDTRERTPGNEWFFFSSQLPVIRSMRRIGFARRAKIGSQLHVYERVEHSFARRAWYGAIDALRYTRLGAELEQLYWRVRDRLSR